MSIRSDYVYERGYRGKVKGLVLDWSGTTADAYVIAPAVVFVEVFKKHGVEISMIEARGPMGLRKDLLNTYMTNETLVGLGYGAGVSYSLRNGLDFKILEFHGKLNPGLSTTLSALNSIEIRTGASYKFLRKK